MTVIQGPSVLLLLLNFSMIRDFNVSIRRRQNLRAASVSSRPAVIISDSDTCATIGDVGTQPQQPDTSRDQNNKTFLLLLLTVVNLVNPVLYDRNDSNIWL